MKLSKKTYRIIRLTENQEEYMVEEMFTIFGIDLWHSHHCDKGGDEIPFSSYKDASTLKAELKMIELLEQGRRNCKIAVLTCTICLCVVLCLI